MTDMMRAVEISEPGGPEVLRLTERPIPEPEHGGVVIRVAWAGVNRPDALQRAGEPAQLPHNRWRVHRVISGRKQQQRVARGRQGNYRLACRDAEDRGARRARERRQPVQVEAASRIRGRVLPCGDGHRGACMQGRRAKKVLARACD